MPSCWPAAAGSGGASVPAEGAPDAVRHAAGEAPHRPAESVQPGLVLLQQPHVVLQLGRGHLDVPGIPEHPPDEAEEDDDGARVDQQVVEEDVDEHADEEDDQPHDVKGHRQPEAARAAAQTPELRLHAAGLRRAGR